MQIRIQAPKYANDLSDQPAEDVPAAYRVGSRWFGLERRPGVGRFKLSNCGLSREERRWLIYSQVNERSPTRENMQHDRLFACRLPAAHVVAGSSSNLNLIIS